MSGFFFAFFGSSFKSASGLIRKILKLVGGWSWLWIFVCGFFDLLVGAWNYFLMNRHYVFFLVFLSFFVSHSKTLDPAGFVSFCSSSSLSPAQVVTRDELIRILSVKDCQGVFDRVNKDNEISHSNCDSRVNKISDLSLLLYFPRLKMLSLGCHKISDLSVLSELKDLETLGLSNNLITDIEPLSRLEKLKYLGLDSNKVTDFKSLRGLKKLKDFYVGGDTLSLCGQNEEINEFCRDTINAYKNRQMETVFELIGAGSDTLVFREFYNIDECCGGRGSADCNYPGLKTMAKKVKAPNNGLTLHFVPYSKTSFTHLDEAIKLGKSFYIYKATYEMGRCQKSDESAKELQAAKDFARSKGIDLEKFETKKNVIRNSPVNIQSCFSWKKAKNCRMAGSIASKQIELDITSEVQNKEEGYEVGVPFWYTVKTKIESKKYEFKSRTFEGAASKERQPVEVYTGDELSILILNMKANAIGDGHSQLTIFPF